MGSSFAGTSVLGSAWVAGGKAVRLDEVAPSRGRVWRIDDAEAVRPTEDSPLSRFRGGRGALGNRGGGTAVFCTIESGVTSRDPGPPDVLATTGAGSCVVWFTTAPPGLALTLPLPYSDTKHADPTAGRIVLVSASMCLVLVPGVIKVGADVCRAKDTQPGTGDGFSDDVLLTENVASVWRDDAERKSSGYG